MKRSIVVAALLGLSAAVPALASEPERASPTTRQPVALSDQQLDEVSAGSLFALPALDTLKVNASAGVSGVNTGLIGDNLKGILPQPSPMPGMSPLSPLLLNSATGLLGSLGP